MRPTAASPATTRILLCASAAHCAQVLLAAAQARIHLHSLQPCTAWPNQPTDTVLWALLPDSTDQPALQLEQQWRQQLINPSTRFSIHMLWGSAQQQAQQLTHWTAGGANSLHSANSPRSASTARTANGQHAACYECLDPRSERQLFQHLLQRRHAAG